MVAHLPVATSPSFGAIADAILHDRISPQWLSLSGMGASHDVNSASVFAARVPGLSASLSSNPERSAYRLLPVSNVSPVLSRSLVSQAVCSRRPGGVRGSGLSPSLPFPSVSKYLLSYRDWLDGQQFPAIASVSSFCERSRPSDVNRKTPALAWRKRRHVLCNRGGDMISLEHGAASTSMQWCRRFGERVYLSSLATLLQAVRHW